LFKAFSVSNARLELIRTRKTGSVQDYHRKTISGHVLLRWKAPGGGRYSLGNFPAEVPEVLWRVGCFP